MDASLEHVERTLARIRRAMTLVALLSLGLLGRVAGAQDSIVVRPAARVPASGPLTLGDVAALTGPRPPAWRAPWCSTRRRCVDPSPRPSGWT